MAHTQELSKEAVLSGEITRSICTVRKKDMPENVPRLDSAQQEGIGLWATEFLTQTGPKDGKIESFPQFFANIPAVIRKIGTHGFKLPNPDVSTPPVFRDFNPENASMCGILYETLLPETLIYSGDASQIRLAKFLIAKISLDSQETCVLYELIKGDKSPVTAALIKCGVPQSVCDLAAEFFVLRDQQNLSKIPVHPLTKQIFFEEEGKDDLVLIPVAPESMIAELHSQSQIPGRWLASRSLCAIGGANPVNGGSLCSDLGGAFQLLQAEPPKLSDQSLAARIKRGGRIYTLYSIPATDILTFTRTARLNEVIGNQDRRIEEIATYEWFAETMLSPLIEADLLIAAGSSAKGEEGGIARYLQRNRNELVTDEIAFDASADVFDIVVKNNKILREHIADSRIRAVLIEKMTEVLL